MTDEKLLLKAQTQDELEQAFEQIYIKYVGLLSFIASRYLSNSDDITDIVQDTFLSFYHHIKSVHNVKYYLVTTCKNQSINLVKKRSRYHLVEIEEIDSLVLMEQHDNDDLFNIMDDMNQILNQKEMDIILLHNMDGLTFQEIGIKLHIPTSSVKSKYFRALNKFNKEIKNAKK